MAVQFFPLEGCLTTATAVRTALANSVIHLFKSSFAPEPTDPLASYTAAECDYDGYAAITFAAWNTPILAPGTGYMIGSPLVQFTWVFDTADVGNLVGGCYVVDAATKLRMTVIFTEPIPMQQAGQGIPINLVWLFPTGL